MFKKYFRHFYCH